jgi:DNA-damage-inducible protein D
MSDAQDPKPLHVSPFEVIRKETEERIEYWSARDMSRLLGYTRWENFKKALHRAEEACENSSQAVSDHFHRLVKMVSIGSGAQREVEDYHLSRYACYLLVQNADPSRPVVALGQTYFAVQTRRQEIADELEVLPEDQLRLVRRSQMTIYNSQLAAAAQDAGVIEPMDFAIFQDHGYKGLYTLKAQEIHASKGLRSGQHILDYMGSDELAANIFRASQTKQKLEREKIKGKEEANRTHFQVGRKVRQTIQELGGALPEDLPAPKESIQDLERKEQKRIKKGLTKAEE